MNDKLQEAGLITISELCKTYDLPGDFLTEVSPLPGVCERVSLALQSPVAAYVGTRLTHRGVNLWLQTIRFD